MKLNKKTQNTESEMLLSTTKSKATLSISEEASNELVQRLTNLYVVPINATIREVISNAIDSSIKVNSDKPIIVTVPNELNREFRVQDFGEGMSKDFLAKKFSQYGVSTKGDDLSQTGAYGLGAKAPLSYCSQFTVYSVKDGYFTELIISSEAEGNFAHFIGHGKSDKPNGTTIIVPVREDDISEFKEILTDYTDFSFEYPIKFNGLEKTGNSYLEIGSISPMEDISIKVYLLGESKLSISRNFLKGKMKVDDLAYTLRGWFYQGTGGIYDRDIIVDIVPGMFDFSSSRDEIMKGNRFNNVDKEIKKLVTDLLVEYSTDNLKSLNDKDLLKFFNSFIEDYSTTTYLKESIYLVMNSMTLSDGTKVIDNLLSQKDSFNFNYGIAISKESKVQYSGVSNEKVSLFVQRPNNGSYYHNEKLSRVLLNDPIKKITEFKENIGDTDLGVGISVIKTSKGNCKYLIVTDVSSEYKEMRKVTSRFKNLSEPIKRYERLILLGTTSSKEEVEKELDKHYINIDENIVFMTEKEYLDKYKTIPKVRTKEERKQMKKANAISILKARKFIYKKNDFIGALRSSLSNEIFSNMNKIEVFSDEAKSKNAKVLILLNSAKSYNFYKSTICSIILNTMKELNCDVEYYFTYGTLINNKNKKWIENEIDKIIHLDTISHSNEEINNLLYDKNKLLDRENYKSKMTISSNDALAQVLKYDSTYGISGYDLATVRYEVIAQNDTFNSQILTDVSNFLSILRMWNRNIKNFIEVVDEDENEYMIKFKGILKFLEDNCSHVISIQEYARRLDYGQKEYTELNLETIKLLTDEFSRLLS